jgi:hypothetical protein
LINFLVVYVSLPCNADINKKYEEREYDELDSHGLFPADQLNYPHGDEKSREFRHGGVEKIDIILGLQAF